METGAENSLSYNKKYKCIVVSQFEAKTSKPSFILPLQVKEKYQEIDLLKPPASMPAVLP
jgi:hypothetical protein